MKWSGKSYYLLPSTVHHSIWHVHEVGTPVQTRDPVQLAESPIPVLPKVLPRPSASVGVYVDDFLYAGFDELLTELHKALKQIFDVGTIEVLGRNGVKAMTFVDLTAKVDAENPTRLLIHQASCAYSLLARFAKDLAGQKTTLCPAPHESFGGDSIPAKKALSQHAATLKNRCQPILGAVL